MNKKISLMLLYVVLAFGCSGKPVKAWEWLDPSYVHIGIEESKTWIPEPPKKGSSEWKKQVKIVLDYQKKRTAEDCARIFAEGTTVKFEVFFGQPYGPLESHDVELLKELMNTIRWDVDHPIHDLKKLYQTDRPFSESSKVTLCPGMRAEKSKSYPSGHAAISRLFALVLSEWDPSRKEIFMKRADEIALGRVYGGFHYANDIAKGKIVAERVWEALKKNSDFAHDFEKLKSR